MHLIIIKYSILKSDRIITFNFFILQVIIYAKINLLKNIAVLNKLMIYNSLKNQFYLCSVKRYMSMVLRKVQGAEENKKAATS